MIAEVALGVPLRRTFDYRVPEDWIAAGALVPGARVIVPFGTRLRGGIVVALKEHSALPEARLKFLHQVTDGPPLFTPEGLAFTRWVADYYLCGWGEVLEAALPSGLGVKIRTLYRLREAVPPSARGARQDPQTSMDRPGEIRPRTPPHALRAPPLPACGEGVGGGVPLAPPAAERWPGGANSPAEPWAGLTEPARRLTVQGEWDDAHWERVATPADWAWLRRQLRPDGAVALRQEFAGTRAKARLEKWVRLAHPGTPVEVQVPALRKRRNPLRESRRERVLRLLQDEGEVPLVRVQAAVGPPGAALRQLRQQGLVVEMLRAGARRDPFGALPPRQEFLPLNAEQQAAVRALHEALAARTYRGFLLQGVTGSGKTEVYLHAVRETLAQGRSALVLVPEIALTAEMVNRFRARFGNAVAVLHSGLGEGERFDEWSRSRAGAPAHRAGRPPDRAGTADSPSPALPLPMKREPPERGPGGESPPAEGLPRGAENAARIVIGARSAVFAPLSGLGLVVVDEEHDGSYKQDESPRYHGRDAAIWRASRAGAVLVLGSATPSLESVHNVALGKLTRLRLGSRIASRPLPPVELVDLRTVARVSGAHWFGVPLVEAVRDTLARGEQALLFLNRRGFASLVRCGACQAPVLCANCSLALTWHQGERRLRCHRCDFARPMPETCPGCGAAELKPVGLGTERLAGELALLFPEARVLRVDSDSLRRRGELERMMGGIRKRLYDIVVGTQILSKGHDFPHITLVGAVLADVSLNQPDFRAPERTFQLLTQMAGRAGRGDLLGRVLIQTYNPGHYALAHVRTHDPDAFAAHELGVRERAATPPFSSQVLLWMSSPSPRAAQRLAHTVAERVRAAAPQEVQVLGPAEAPIAKLAGRFRWMLLLRGARIGPLQRLARQVLDDPALKLGAGERIAVDVDPYSVL